MRERRFIVGLRRALSASGAVALFCAALLLVGGEVFAQETPPAKAHDVLRYDRDDLNKVAKDKEQPLRTLINEGFRDHKTVHAIWADVASRYVEAGQWQAAWEIQRPLLNGLVRGAIPFDEKLIQKVVTDILRLPERSMPWSVIEDELLKPFEGQERNSCAVRAAGPIVKTLESAGGASKARALGDRLMKAYPDGPLGVEAAKHIAASLPELEAYAGELAGTRAGVEVCFRIADTLAELGSHDKAVSAYEKRLGPDVPPDDEMRALNGILASCEQAGAYAKALEHATRLLDRSSGEEAVALAGRIAGMYLHLEQREGLASFCASAAAKHGMWRPAAMAELLLSVAQSAEEKGWQNEAADLYAACWCVVAEANDLRTSRLPSCKADASVRVRFWKQALGLAEGVVSQETVRALAESEPGTREAAHFHYVSAEEAASSGEYSTAAQHARTLVSLCHDSSAAAKLLSRIEAQLAAHEAEEGEEIRRADAGAQGAGVEDLLRLAEERRAAGDASAAVSALLLMAAGHPQSELAPRALYDAAMLQRDALNDPRAAQTSLDRLCVIYPDSELGITALRLLDRMDIAR